MHSDVPRGELVGLTRLLVWHDGLSVVRWIGDVFAGDQPVVLVYPLRLLPRAGCDIA